MFSTSLASKPAFFKILCIIFEVVDLPLVPVMHILNFVYF